MICRVNNRKAKIMFKMKSLALVGLLPLILGSLTACQDAGDAATLGFSGEGMTQSITITSNPAGAACTLTRDGQAIGSVSATPNAVQVVETDGDINVNCSGNGLTGTAVIHANVAGSALVGMLSDLLPNDVYPSDVTVVMGASQANSTATSTGEK